MGYFHQPSGLPLSLVFAIPDHPWVDATAKDEKKAAVRIAMTVGVSGAHAGELRTVVTEEPQEDGAATVAFAAQTGRIAADLTTGADVSGAVELKANERLTYRGVQLIGSGFIVSPEQAKILGLGTVRGAEQHIRQYRNGRDLTDAPRDGMCIELFGLSADETRQRFPAICQHVLTHVKPEREANNRESYRRNWWIFGEPRRDLRPALAGLPRYIATVETAKHRIFQFLSADVLPDNKLVVIALDDAFHLGVLSSRIHVVYSLVAGSWLGVGNDPVHAKTRCFDPFPFPACDEAAKARIRLLGEELDAHRKRVQAQHPGLSLTAMYNVLEALRAGRALSPKEQQTHDAGLVSVLRQLHDELDAAVAAAYGWTDLSEMLASVRDVTLHHLTTRGKTPLAESAPDFVAARAACEKVCDADILTRLVALNATRAGTTSQTGLGITTKGTKDAKKGKATKAAKLPWPTSLAERVAATERALKSAPGSTTAAELAKTFTRARPEDLAEILETLATLGRAHRDGERYST